MNSPIKSKEPAQQEHHQEFLDRRQDTRIRVEIPARIEIFDSGTSSIESIDVTVTGVSKVGISAVLRETKPLPGHVHLEMSLPGFDGSIKTQADVRWMRTVKGSKGFEYGLELTQTAQPYRELLNLFLARSVTDRGAGRDRRIKTTVRSEPFQFINSRGRKIIGYIDMPVEKNRSTGRIIAIMPPAYGETKTGAVSVGYFAATNGIPAVRYDATDHVGESDGDLLDCTLKKMQDDLADVINHFQNHYGYERFGIIASSLAARVAIKTTALDSRVGFLGALVPVVHVRKTLESVYNEDLVGGHIRGQKWGTIDMLGFQIHADQFLSDAVRWDFHFLSSTIKDLSQIKVPFYFVLGEDDPWVDRREVEESLRTSGHSEKNLSVLSGMIHQFQENPKAVKEALREIISRLRKTLDDSFFADDEIRDPNFREIALQARLEKEKLRYGSLAAKDTGSEEFWNRYLERFHFIIRIPQYREFYERLTSFLGLLGAGESILDAGCGNGSFGVWQISKWLEKTEAAAQSGSIYVGADFVPQALEYARSVHTELLSDLKKTHPGVHFHTVYNLVDLNNPLPYMDNYFQQICCNLVLSYVANARNSLMELFRVLKFGGRMVITSLKPNPDLSLIYRAFLDQAKTEDESREARRLLNNAASILEKEKEGRFKFFSEREFQAIAQEADISSFQIERGFGNQANILFVKK